LHKIEQAAGCGHHDFDPLHDRADLTSHRDAADRQRRREAHVTAIGIEALENLSRQFSRRAQHQHAAGFGLRLDAIFQNAMQDRSAKAAVLPVPVWAMPTTSRPVSAMGMV